MPRVRGYGRATRLRSSAANLGSSSGADNSPERLERPDRRSTRPLLDNGYVPALGTSLNWGLFARGVEHRDPILVAKALRRIDGRDRGSEWRYEIFLAYWPNQNGPIAKAFNNVRKYVVTRSLDPL